MAERPVPVFVSVLNHGADFARYHFGNRIGFEIRNGKRAADFSPRGLNSAAGGYTP